MTISHFVLLYINKWFYPKWKPFVIRSPHLKFSACLKIISDPFSIVFNILSKFSLQTHFKIFVHFQVCLVHSINYTSEIIFIGIFWVTSSIISVSTVENVQQGSLKIRRDKLKMGFYFVNCFFRLLEPLN